MILSSISRPHRIFIDARECSVKAEIYRLAGRHGMRVALISEEDIGAPFEPWLTKVVTGAGLVPDIILAEASIGDLVITDDEALAQRLLGRTAQTLTTRGQRWTENGAHPPLPVRIRGNNSRARFLTVLEDEILALLQHKSS